MNNINKNIVLFYCEETTAVNFNTGIQRYFRMLAKSLLEIGVPIVPVYFHDGSLQPIEQDKLYWLQEFDGPKVESWDINLFSKNLLDEAKVLICSELPVNYGADTFKNVIELCRKNEIFFVSVFHDATPYMLEDCYSNKTSQEYYSYMNDIAEGDLVISVSKSSHDDFCKMFDIGERAKYLLSPHNILVDENLPKRNNDSKEINIISVSCFDPRKNQTRLVQAYSIAKKKAQSMGYLINLTIVGGYGFDTQNAERFMELADKNNVTIRQNISDEELSKEYLRSDFSIYPSLYEGYGFPIAEALSYGLPVLCSNTSSMMEISKFGGCVTFNPKDVHQLSEKIISLSLNKKKRDRLTDEIKLIKFYGWNNYADDFMKIVYQSINKVGE